MTKNLKKLLTNFDSLEVVGMADGGKAQIQLNKNEVIAVNIQSIFKELAKLLPLNSLQF